MSDDNTRDGAEPSPASAGSAANDQAEVLAKGIADIIRIAAEPDWIPVTERLPEDGVPVAIVADRGRTPDNRGVVAAGELYRGCWYHTLPGLVVRQIADVTHWMPLPAPPASKE